MHGERLCKSGPRTNRDRRRGERRRPRPFIRSLGYCVERSDVDLLGDLNGVIDLDAEIANGAFDFRVSEQKLNRSEVPSSPVDQHRLCAAKRVRAELGWVEADAGHPLLYKSCILSGGQPARAITAASKQKLARLSVGQSQVLVDSQPRLVGQREPHWPACLPLPDSRTIDCITIRCHVIDVDRDNVTASQLAVDCQVEQREIPLATLDVLGPDRPNVARPERRLRALFQGGRQAGLSTPDT